MVLKPQPNDLLNDIPRGVTTRRLSEQTAPQAQFLSTEEIIRCPDLAYDPDNPGDKILLGAIGNRLIGISDNRHILTGAGTRAGKSVTLINNLFFYRGSVVCNDTKGEVTKKTAEWRAKKLKQKVFLLDPFKVVKGKAAQYRCQFNPMSLLTLDNPFIVEVALLITDAFILSSGEEKEPHWNESAAHLITGLMLYVAINPEIKPQDKHLITVRRLLNHILRQVKEDGTPKFILEENANRCAKTLTAQGYGDVAAVMLDAIRGFYDKGYEERGGVLSNARRHTQLLDFSSMKNVLMGHDFNLEDLKRLHEGMTVYMVLPAIHMTTCQRFLRVLLNLLLDAMERETHVPKAPVLVCLDEFPVLGFMKQLQDAAGQIASFHVKLWVILQDWGQGKSLYKDRFESFAANAGVMQFFGNVDATTTEYISKGLGQTLVEDARLSEVTRDQKQKGLSGRNHHRQLFPLLTPDEVARTFARDDHLKRQLILWAGLHPMIIQRIEYFDPNGVLAPWLKW